MTDHKALVERLDGMVAFADKYGMPVSTLCDARDAIEALVREVEEQAKWRRYHTEQQEKAERERDEALEALRRADTVLDIHAKLVESRP